MNREFFRLAFPNILTNLTVPLVSLVDIGLMGRMPSSSFILAIGFGTLIFNFIYWAFGFLRMGTTGMVSQAYGSYDGKERTSLLFMGSSISLIAGILFVLFQYPILQGALILISPDDLVVAPLSTYFYWRIYAAPATITIYVITGWLLGMQDSKSALFLAIAVNGINAIVSYLLVYYADLSIKGVALGTVIAQYAGLLYGVYLIQKKHSVRWKDFSINLLKEMNTWKSFIQVNSDIFIRTLCLIFAMSFFKTKAGNIDPILGAANILLLEFVTLSAYGIDGFAFAAESICGKYFGRRNKVQFILATKTAFKQGFLFALLMSAVFFVFGKEILSVLTNKVNVIQAAMPYVKWLILLPLVSCFAFIWDGVYIGTTASKAMRNTLLIATFFIFLPLFFLLKEFFGNHGMWIAFLIFLLARGVIQTILAPTAILSRFD